MSEGTPSGDSRASGRPRRGKVVIDSARIGDATLEVLSTWGVNGLTMSSIAKVLDVRSQTLYYHVSNLSEAINLARGVVIDRVNVELLERDPWDDAVARFAVEYYRAFHPLGQENAAFFMFVITNKQVLWTYERFLARAIRVGVDGQDALQLLLDTEHMVFSTILEHTAWNSLFSPEAIEREGCRLLESLLQAREISPEAIEQRVYAAALRLARAAAGRDTCATD